jgi:hypothetical protein
VQHLAAVSGVAQATAPQALDVYFTRPLCPGVVDLVDPVQAVLRQDVVIDGDFVLDAWFESLEGVCLRQHLQTVLQFPLRILKFAVKLA